jgi:hypothetical protein
LETTSPGAVMRATPLESLVTVKGPLPTPGTNAFAGLGEEKVTGTPASARPPSS